MLRPRAGRGGVSCDPRRRGFRRSQRRGPEVRLPVRSGGAVDGCDARTGVLRLRRQLFDRCEVRHRHGCRSLARHPSSRGGRRQDHDRANRGALRPEARTAGGGYGLWISSQSQVAAPFLLSGPSGEYCQEVWRIPDCRLEDHFSPRAEHRYRWISFPKLCDRGY
jgi:hypothetical protein